MSSAPRPEGAANSSERDLFIGMATGVNESSQVFQNVQPMYRESGHANVSFEFAQENEMRGVYPSPVGTPVALSYNGGVDLQHWQTSAMQFSQVPTSPAQVVADHRFSVPQPDYAYAPGYSTVTVDRHAGASPVDRAALAGVVRGPLPSAEQVQGFPTRAVVDHSFGTVAAVQARNTTLGYPSVAVDRHGGTVPVYRAVPYGTEGVMMQSAERTHPPGSWAGAGFGTSQSSVGGLPSYQPMVARNYPGMGMDGWDAPGGVVDAINGQAGHRFQDLAGGATASPSLPHPSLTMVDHGMAP